MRGQLFRCMGRSSYRQSAKNSTADRLLFCFRDDRLGHTAVIQSNQHQAADYRVALPRERGQIELKNLISPTPFWFLFGSSEPLSEAVTLLAGYVRMGHLDRELFELFLREGVHLRFAHRFLNARQIDEVDIEAALKQAG